MRKMGYVSLLTIEHLLSFIWGALARVVSARKALTGELMWSENERSEPIRGGT